MSPPLNVNPRTRSIRSAWLVTSTITVRAPSCARWRRHRCISGGAGVVSPVPESLKLPYLAPSDPITPVGCPPASSNARRISLVLVLPNVAVKPISVSCGGGDSYRRADRSARAILADGTRMQGTPSGTAPARSTTTASAPCEIAWGM